MSCIYSMVWLSWLGTVLMSLAYGGLALNILTGIAEASNARHPTYTALLHCQPYAACVITDAPFPRFRYCGTQWAANSTLDEVMSLGEELIGVTGTCAILVFTLAFFILFSLFALCMYAAPSSMLYALLLWRFRRCSDKTNGWKGLKETNNTRAAVLASTSYGLCHLQLLYGEMLNYLCVHVLSGSSAARRTCLDSGECSQLLLQYSEAFCRLLRLLQKLPPIPPLPPHCILASCD